MSSTFLPGLKMVGLPRMCSACCFCSARAAHALVAGAFCELLSACAADKLGLVVCVPLADDAAVAALLRGGGRQRPNLQHVHFLVLVHGTTSAPPPVAVSPPTSCCCC